MSNRLLWAGAIALAGVVACSASGNQHHPGSGAGGSAGPGDESPGNGGSGAASPDDEGSGGLFDPGQPGTGGATDCAGGGPDDDVDGDGFTPAQGDCNDCDANVNPAAVEVIAPADADPPVEAVDEDCDGLTDDLDPDLMPCDAGLALDGGAEDGARAIDLCKLALTPQDWGVIEARWVMADGSPPPAGNAKFDLGHGILGAFGPNVNVQRGERMLGVSSGTARQPDDAGYQNVVGFGKGYDCNHPEGFPKESPSCGIAATGDCLDSTGLELMIRAPSNAHGFSFNFNFFTFEWPIYVCTPYNDFFAAILMPYPAGQTDGNITFDNLGNPISVNSAFVEVCGCLSGPPCTAGGKMFDCSLGASALEGTGFGKDLAGSDHASTSWLLTQAPVEPGSVLTLRFVAYDSADGILDSTGLIDNFQWIAEPGTSVGTTPLPDPK